MKFATAKEHRDFFQKQGWIEFDEFLTSQQLEKANLWIDQALAMRQNIPIEKLHFLSSEKLYLNGHDLWRTNQNLLKLATQPRFVKIVSELIDKKPLRLGYDQFLPVHKKVEGGEQTYSHFLEQTANLETISCLREILCGMIWNLGNAAENISETSDGIDVFPKKRGNAIFFRPEAMVNWNNLKHHPEQNFYMVVFTGAISHYFLQPTDPHTHALKGLGYIFNDKLKDNLHPIVYR